AAIEAALAFLKWVLDRITGFFKMKRTRCFLVVMLIAGAVSLVQAQQQPGVVSGRVVLDGKASTSVEVVLLTEGNERRTEIARTSTDAEGRFRLNVEEA